MLGLYILNRTAVIWKQLSVARVGGGAAGKFGAQLWANAPGKGLITKGTGNTKCERLAQTWWCRIGTKEFIFAFYAEI